MKAVGELCGGGRALFKQRVEMPVKAQMRGSWLCNPER